jgi:exonuclease III
MRIVAWNVNHRTVPKPIAPTLAAAIVSLDPDVVVLTEYVQSEQPYGHDFLCEGLRDGGLAFVQVSPQTAAHHDGQTSRRASNQVIVASRSRTEPGGPLEPEPTPFAASNYLHVMIPSVDAHLIGLRVPSYDKRSDLRAYWEWFEARVEASVRQRMVIIGDLNANPKEPRRDIGSRCLDRIKNRGDWFIPDPTGETWSYWPFRESVSPSRIDHALVSPGFRCVDARYVARSGNHVLAGSSRDALSDHAALVLDIVSV